MPEFLKIVNTSDLEKITLPKKAGPPGGQVSYASRRIKSDPCTNNLIQDPLGIRSWIG
jgi:hypothetical protein